MLITVKGSWTSEAEFHWTDSEQWVRGISNMQKLGHALLELHSQFDNDSEMLMDSLGITHAIKDQAMFTQAYDQVVRINPFSINRMQYSQYVWLCAVLRHTLANGELIYNNRTVLLDTHEPDDHFIIKATE